MIWGREDPIAVHAIAERLDRENPGAELTTLDGVGHYPQLEAPDAVATHLINDPEPWQRAGRCGV